jgi:hypothetical protein
MARSFGVAFHFRLPWPCGVSERRVIDIRAMRELVLGESIKKIAIERKKTLEADVRVVSPGELGTSAGERALSPSPKSDQSEVSINRYRCRAVSPRSRAEALVLPDLTSFNTSSVSASGASEDRCESYHALSCRTRTYKHDTFGGLSRMITCSSLRT